MKKLLVLFLVVLLAITRCGTIQKELETTTYYNKMFSLSQVDSIMTAENVTGLDSIPLRGSEKTYYEYYFLKDSLVLRFIEKGDSVQVTKRINK